jgi:hypothetical protein
VALIYTKIIVILIYLGNASSRSVDRSIGQIGRFYAYRGLK